MQGSGLSHHVLPFSHFVKEMSVNTARDVKINAYSEISNLSPSGAVEGDVEVTEEKALGALFAEDGRIVIRYKTKGEGGEVESEISVADSALRVKRCGAVTSDFLFREGEEHKSLYSVGQFAFDTVIKTRKIRFGMTDAGGRVDVYYDMTIGGADKYVKMKLIAE